MSKTLTLSHNQAGILIMSLAVVVAYGTEGDNDDAEYKLAYFAKHGEEYHG